MRKTKCFLLTGALLAMLSLAGAGCARRQASPSPLPLPPEQPGGRLESGGAGQPPTSATNVNTGLPKTQLKTDSDIENALNGLTNQAEPEPPAELDTKEIDSF